MLPDSISLDDLDFSIIEFLQEDGRKSFTDIARELNVAPNTIRARVNRMREDGILLVAAGLNPHKVGIDAYAGIDIAVEPVHLDAVIHKLIRCSEVIWIAERTGVFDLAVEVVCRDMNHLHKFLHECVHNLQGVKDTETMIYLKSHKNAAFPIRELIRNPGA